MPSSGRVGPVLKMRKLDLFRPAPLADRTTTCQGPPISATGFNSGKFAGRHPLPGPAALRKTTNQLCRGANASGTAVRPLSRRHSVRLRISPVTASQSSGCFPAVRKTASTVVAVVAEVGNEVDLGLAVAAMDPVEPRRGLGPPELDVRRHAVGLRPVRPACGPRSLGRVPTLRSPEAAVPGPHRVSARSFTSSSHCRIAGQPRGAGSAWPRRSSRRFPPARLILASTAGRHRQG